MAGDPMALVRVVAAVRQRWKAEAINDPSNLHASRLLVLLDYVEALEQDPQVPILASLQDLKRRVGETTHVLEETTRKLEAAARLEPPTADDG